MKEDKIRKIIREIVEEILEENKEKTIDMVDSKLYNFFFKSFPNLPDDPNQGGIYGRLGELNSMIKDIEEKIKR